VLLASNETGMRAVTGASNGGKSTAYCMAAEALRGVIYIPFKQKSAEESTELFLARTLRFSGPKPTERLVGGVLREPLQRALQRMRVEHNIKYGVCVCICAGERRVIERWW
jgi:hypothetical protein